MPAIKTSGYSLWSWLFGPVHYGVFCWKNVGLEIANKVRREGEENPLSLFSEELMFIRVEAIELIWFWISCVWIFLFVFLML